MNAIEIRNLSKSFGRHFAVRDFDMNVPEGSIFGFIGENGAGKSTTQKLICGVLVPTEGEVQLFGKPYNDADIRAKMGVLIERPGVYLVWTAYENLMMQALNIGVKNPEETVKKALDTVGLGNTGKKKVREFSLGMKQRLGIAAAFLGNPRLLVLDEPINVLDPEGIREIRQTLQRLNREYGITILISSHILGELSKIATHYGIIRNGTMIKEISAEAFGGGAMGLNFLWVLTGILLSIYIGSDYTTGFIKNNVTSHANKLDYIISKGMTALVCNVLLCIVYIITLAIAGFALGCPLQIPSVFGFVLYLLELLISSVAMSSLIIMINLIFRRLYGWSICFGFFIASGIVIMGAKMLLESIGLGFIANFLNITIAGAASLAKLQPNFISLLIIVVISAVWTLVYSLISNKLMNTNDVL